MKKKPKAWKPAPFTENEYTTYLMADTVWQRTLFPRRIRKAMAAREHRELRENWKEVLS